jgi:5-methylthioadenosine/S-adenosylhomocysteine deaminase
MAWPVAEEPHMPTSLIRNVDVVTLDEQGTVLRAVELAIANGQLVAVGQAPDDFVPNETIDGSHRVALPGFFNAHTHAAMTLVRGWADDLPLDRWFNERIWVAESALEEEDVYWGAALAAAEMIRSGTVGFADHYFWMDQVARVVESSGMRATLAWCVFGLENGEIGTDLQGTVDFVQRWHGAGDGRIRALLGPHSPYICSPNFLARTAAVAARMGTGIHIHVAESQEQVNNSLERHGRTPVEVLEANGIFSVPTIAAHCIYVQEWEMRDILAPRGVHVVQCPNCHMKLGMGTTLVPDMLSAGVHVALGTDGAASNNDLDMLQEACLAALLQKHERRDPEQLPGDLALRLATQNGALACGFPKSGVLAPGRAADLILFDFDQPHLWPRHSLVSNILHAAKSTDICDVMVGGRWLMRNRELLTLDEERIRREAEQRAFRMVGSELQTVRQYRG